MNLFLTDFISGMHEALKLKYANAELFQTGSKSSVLPTIEKQTNWKYSRNENILHLDDGNNIHVFELTDENSNDNFPAVKKDDGIFPLNNKLKQHTAQVHRANPAVLYVTLHDGASNPTYTFRHENEATWRVMPKVKKAEISIEVSPEDFLSGLLDKTAEDGVLSSILKGIDYSGRKAINGVMTPGHDPYKAMGLGVLAGGVYDLAKRNLYNTEDENKEESALQRISRILAPGLVAGGVGGVTSSLFPNYYSHYPMYKA